MLLPLSRGLCLSCDEKKTVHSHPAAPPWVPHGTMRRMGFKGGSADVLFCLCFIQTRQSSDAVSSCIIFLFSLCEVPCRGGGAAVPRQVSAKAVGLSARNSSRFYIHLLTYKQLAAERRRAGDNSGGRPPRSTIYGMRRFFPS